MDAALDIVDYIIKSLLSVLSLLVLLRFILQWVRADFYNPISQGIVRFTSPLLKPLRKIIPGMFGLDMAALMLALLIHIVSLTISVLLKQGNPFEVLHFITAIAALKILASLLNIASFCLLVSIVLSFVAPMSNHPAAMLVNQIAEPLMKPFRKLLPDMGGLDLSPILVFLTIGVLTKIFAIAASSLGIPVGQMWLFIVI